MATCLAQQRQPVSVSLCRHHPQGFVHIPAQLDWRALLWLSFPKPAGESKLWELLSLDAAPAWCRHGREAAQCGWEPAHSQLCRGERLLGWCVEQQVLPSALSPVMPPALPPALPCCCSAPTGGSPCPFSASLPGTQGPKNQTFPCAQ